MGIGYDPEAALDARARILAFFGRHLADQPGPSVAED